MNQDIYYRLFNFITYQVYHTIGMEILHIITEKSLKFSDFMKNETDFLKMFTCTASCFASSDKFVPHFSLKRFF